MRLQWAVFLQLSPTQPFSTCCPPKTIISSPSTSDHSSVVSQPLDHAEDDFLKPEDDSTKTPLSTVPAPTATPLAVPIEGMSIRPRSTRLTSRPYKLADYHVYLANQNPDLCMTLLAHSTSDVNLDEALSDPHWCAAMQTKMDAHSRNNTWELTTLPPGSKALSARWVLREKTDQYGSKKFKARVVARGNEQQERLDYEETFRQVVNRSADRCSGCSIRLDSYPHGRI